MLSEEQNTRLLEVKHCSEDTESQDHYLQKKPSVTISQYYSAALQKGNYMESFELMCSFVPTRDKHMCPYHPNWLMYCS